MRKLLLSLLFAIFSFAAHTQSTLSVEKIMQDPKWIGTSPSDLQWSPDGKALFFKWNPEKAKSDSLYLISLKNKKPIKLVPELAADVSSTGEPEYNQARSAYVYSRGGDIFYHEIKTGITRRLTQTPGTESAPRFSFNEERIVYLYNQQLYSWSISHGTVRQLTDFKTGNPPPAKENNRAAGSTNQQETWLERDQLEQFEVLKSRKATKDSQEAWKKSLVKTDKVRTVYTEDMHVQGVQISPDGRFISYSLFKPATGAKPTIVPAFVTESGFTTDIPARTKVGSPMGRSTFFILDRKRDSIFEFKTDSVPGIRDLPDYVKDYPKQLEQLTQKPVNREVFVTGVNWSPSAGYAVLDLRARDNKDRWLLLWQPETGTYTTLDRQREEAWIGGPGISFPRNSGWINDHQFWFQSEVTGYSHLYVIDVNTKEKKALTAGNFEIQQAVLSHDKKYFFITTNEVHPGEKQFYRLSIADGKKERVTTLVGSNQVTISPDQKHLAILYSYSNKPWELYLQENKPGAAAEQITHKAQSDEFKSYPWRDPELVTFTAADSAGVHARLYKPANPHPSKPAVIFVHGAGYLQNAHKWWSSYFREYMFHNLLADLGYTVLDIDYRGSAGYGRDWRTGIYRHMGGKDLSDHVDAAKWLVSVHGVDPKRIGIYGGSYGGFITLMALFNESQHFASGAALRPVTDWANYNHGYTSNILNEPFTDSLAYRRSSPLYFADGLKGHLLICHGMVDENVHYQDAVKLVQRLIELGKDNWELASYPVEDHGFVEPSSWTDEYKRILKLFEQTLKK